MAALGIFVFISASLIHWGAAFREDIHQLDQWNNEAKCFFDDRMHALRCRNTDLRDIQRGIDELIFEIFVLDINFCDVPHVSSPLIGNHSMSDLRTVTLVNSGLEHLAQNAFAGLEAHLEHLDLSGNRLSQVPPAVLNMSKLVSLDLSHNLIHSLPPGSAFNSLNTLVRLDLSENSLGTVPHPVVPNRSSSLSSQAPETGSAVGPSISIPKAATEFSLLSFNLEPLTDTLEDLDLSANHLAQLPSQFVNRTFARLRKLNLAKNPLQALPLSAFSGMNRLEILNLAHSDLTTFVLARMPPVLRELHLVGNPLQCDCQARWLWLHATQGGIKSIDREEDLPATHPGDKDRRPPGEATNQERAAVKDESKMEKDSHDDDLKDDLAQPLPEVDQKMRLKIELPPCAAPFSVKSATLPSLKDSELCVLLPGERLPRFFRVTDQDKPSFPNGTFESLRLLEATPTSAMNVNLSWRVNSSFYQTDYDWGVIFREIGHPTHPPDIFFKTQLDLASHISNQTGWRPSTENFEDSLTGFEADTYYEICLAAVDHTTIYYVHQTNCQEIRMLESLPHPEIDGVALLNSSQVALTAKATEITAIWPAWNSSAMSNGALSNSESPILDSVQMEIVRQISVREFGDTDATHDVVIESFNATATDDEDDPRFVHVIPGLKPSTAYVVCWQTIVSEKMAETEGDEVFQLRKARKAFYPPSQDEECQEIVTTSSHFGGSGLVLETLGSTQGTVLESDGSTSLASPTSAVVDESEEAPQTMENVFPLMEVATATAAASASTAIIVAIVCCCCFGPKACSRNQNDGTTTKEIESGLKSDEAEEDETKDENDNTKLAGGSSGQDTISFDGLEKRDEIFQSSSLPSINSADEAEEEVASKQFKSSIISVLSTPSIDTVDYDDDDEELEHGSFRDHNFADATIQSHRQEHPNAIVAVEGGQNKSRRHPDRHSRSSASPSKFWPSCFSGNSSLYSQYDYTIHSEAKSPHLNEIDNGPVSSGSRQESPERAPGVCGRHQRRRDNELTEALSHHHHGHNHGSLYSNQKGFHSKMRRRMSEGEPNVKENQGCGGEPLGSWGKKTTTFSDRHTPHYFAKKPPHHAKGILRQPSSSTHVALPRFSDPAPFADSGQVPSMPASFHYHANSLSALGPGNYHTISNYQFCRRPYQPTSYAYYPSPIGPIGGGGEYYQSHSYVARPFDPRYAVDYSKTLGRKRRESPMAMVPVHLPAPTHPLPANNGTPFELKSLNWKKFKSRSASKSSGGSDNYKMFTWSPYGSNGPVFYPSEATAVFPVRLKHPAGKSLEDLRF
eukprot:maker-scaffold186_size273091-snap-gene-1.45 protein:Tk00925 transcript:maker-scaffold186_size273091-snap-gene-1.45-mRNA-1 annotation:"leucine-rich transmembrane"